MDINKIIKACLAKDEKAFRILVDHYCDLVFSVALRIVNNIENAKDIVQETFIAVWSGLESFNSEKDFKNWLYKITVNKSLDSLRRQKRSKLMIQPEYDLQVLSSLEGPDKKMENAEIAKTIKMLSLKLSPKQKIVFVLSELEDLNHDEISEITGMNKKSIKSNLNHARRKIGEWLKNIN